MARKLRGGSWNQPKQDRQDRRRDGNRNTARPRHEDSNVVDLTQERRFHKKIELIPRNLKQEDFIEQLMDDSKYVVFATGPAGCGKTYLTVLCAIKMLKEGLIEKIIVSRPAVEVDGEKHGFLPGDLNQKMEPWTRPIFDVFHEHYSVKETSAMIAEQIIEVAPLSFLRGRTLKKAFVILDEAQNTTPNQMKMILTRIGEGSRMVVTGDVRQADRKEHENGLLDFGKLLTAFGDSNMIAWTQFSHKEIERHPIVSEVLKIYGEKD